MSEEGEAPADDGPAGSPAWMATFADLMSLLMCFFVLLLSFSEIQKKKYKQVAGSMKEAFGVQREIHADQSPKGTSFVAQEFSAGKPTPTALNVLRQDTANEFKQDLDFTDSASKNEKEQGGMDGESDKARADMDELQEQQFQQLSQYEEQQEESDEQEAIAELLQSLAQALADEIKDGQIQIAGLKGEIAIRVQEKGSFKSGRANIQSTFVPTLDKISKILGLAPGNIIVEGHTDNVPISTRQFPSNWELSAARAATFVHFLKRRGRIDPRRLEIRARADGVPLADNKSAAGRAKNRRVEIMLVAEKPQTKVFEAVKASDIPSG